jgi:hypothetical protein
LLTSEARTPLFSLFVRNENQARRHSQQAEPSTVYQPEPTLAGSMGVNNGVGSPMV